MQKYEICGTDFEGVYKVKPFVNEDARGAFIKDYSEELLKANGIDHILKEVFYTYSHPGVVRAIHFQRVKEQAKLVRCVKGSIFDIIVDLRPKSKTFGKWQGFYLNDKNAEQILVPKHFGHGYLVLEESIVSYKCDEKFYGEYDDGIRWDDKDIGVEWPLDKIGGKDHVILSQKDLELQSFADYSIKLGVIHK